MIKQLSIKKLISAVAIAMLYALATTGLKACDVEYVNRQEATKALLDPSYEPKYVTMWSISDE